MPRNCTTCKYHHCYYDGYGFDGCTCDKSYGLFSEYGGKHKWCYEFSTWALGQFDPETDDCDCEFWEEGDGE